MLAAVVVERKAVLDYLGRVMVEQVAAVQVRMVFQLALA
jgi:hypothetical protein